MNEVLFVALTAAIAASVSLAVFAICFCWFRREQRRMQKKIMNAIADSVRDTDAMFLTGNDATVFGELIAQLRVNHGKQVVSVLELEGKRFIHVDGELSTPERARVVRYLKSEGFMA